MWSGTSAPLRYSRQRAPCASITCKHLGFEYGSARVINDDGVFGAAFPGGITVEVTDDTYVEGTSAFSIGAVIVKGGAAPDVYEYAPASFGDSGLAAPRNPSGGPAGLSNLTCC